MIGLRNQRYIALDKENKGANSRGAMLVEEEEDHHESAHMRVVEDGR